MLYVIQEEYVGGSVDKNGAYICTRCNDQTIPDYEEMCQQAPGVELDSFFRR